MSALFRLHAFSVVAGFGAKKKGGGDLKPEDLWKVKFDKKSVGLEFAPGSPEHKEWYKNIQQRFKLK